ncbi:MAG: hypothetical protein JO015_06265 [Verrucomicrobia bacterium]|nr:hypothetical protein [Verrucomicrobiota bacterium]
MLRAVVLWALVGVLLNGAARGADARVAPAPEPLDIHVQAGGFGRASSPDIAAVLQAAAGELWRHCRGSRLGGIEVYHRADHPQLDLKRTPDGRIAIGLTAQGTHWAQYGFQFAHEFCHGLANFADSPQQLERFPPQANLWLEESLCETASLFALRAMSRSWQTDPPYPAWREYAPWLNAYAEQRLRLPEHQLPVGEPFIGWFRRNQSALRQNAGLRDRNTIIAIRLLPLFESEPRGWETLVFLNHGSADLNASLAQHLSAWRSRCPADLRPFVRRLAAVFAIRM